MTAAAGTFVIGLLVGVGVGEMHRRHLRRVNTLLAQDLTGARRLRDAWMTQAIARRTDRDWVPRADVVRLAHFAELSELLAEENESLRDEVALWRRHREDQP